VLQQGWTHVKPASPAADHLEKAFQFGDFVSCFGFMTQVALFSEKLDHHPDWNNLYNRVTVRWSTHTANGVTDKDFAMAIQCDEIASRLT
jgi:4a-hydroxytetrahydrobiopterin dehydratase